MCERITKFRKYSNEYDNRGFAVARVSNDMVSKLGRRNTWVELKSSGGKVYRTIKGAGSLDIPRGAVELDYEAVLELNLDRQQITSDTASDEASVPFRNCDLKVRPIWWWEKVVAHWKHPDPAFRVPLQLALILGSLSLITSILGLILGFALA
jgi:hypothetical protein